MLAFNFVFVFSCLALARSEHLPNYIVPCNISTPEFQKCFLLHGRDTIPHLLKGDPKVHLPPLVPFKVEKAELKPSDKLTLILRDLELYGLDTLEMKDAEVDLKNRQIKISLYAKLLKFIANYHVEGQILVLPLSGDGPADLHFGDGNYELTFDYDLVTKKDGKKYISNPRINVTFKVAKPHYHFENLFNGNKQLGENANKVLNENSQEVLNDFGAAISEIVGAIAKGIIESYLLKVPYDEIFLH